MSIRTKILFSFLLLIIMSQGVSFYVLDMLHRLQQNALFDRQLQQSVRIFHRQLSARVDSLAQTAELVAADAQFKKALAAEDRATLDEILERNRQRIGANIGVVLDEEGHILTIAGSATPTEIDEFSEKLMSFSKRLESEGYDGTIAAGYSVYQANITAVVSGKKQGYIVLASKFDAEMARDIESLSLTNLFFIMNDDSKGQEYSVIISDAPKGHAQHIVEALRADRGRTTQVFKDNTRVSFVQEISSLDPSKKFFVVLQKNNDETQKILADSRSATLIASAMLISIAMLAAYFIGQKITVPINEISKAIQASEEGNLAYRIKTSGNSTDTEYLRLAASFNAMMSSIQEREKMRHMAYHDGLTGIANRRYFIEQLREIWAQRENTSATLLMLDLDGFKPVNDQHGHAAGDEALVVVGKRLKEAARNNFDVVARLGGDEFAIIFRDMADREYQTEKAAHILECLAEPITIGQKQVRISASIGIASLRDNLDSMDHWMERADKACYEAKHSGKNTFVIKENDAA